MSRLHNLNVHFIFFGSLICIAIFSAAQEGVKLPPEIDNPVFILGLILTIAGSFIEVIKIGAEMTPMMDKANLTYKEEQFLKKLHLRGLGYRSFLPVLLILGTHFRWPTTFSFFIGPIACVFAALGIIFFLGQIFVPE